MLQFFWFEYFNLKTGRCLRTPVSSMISSEAEPNTAYVDEDLCSGCSLCISVCPYKAIESVKEIKNDKKITHAKVNEALCMGCGACVAACPSGAMQQRGFKDVQIMPVIEETI